MIELVPFIMGWMEHREVWSPGHRKSRLEKHEKADRQDSVPHMPAYKTKRACSHGMAGRHANILPPPPCLVPSVFYFLEKTSLSFSLRTLLWLFENMHVRQKANCSLASSIILLLCSPKEEDLTLTLLFHPWEGRILYPCLCFRKSEL